MGTWRACNASHQRYSGGVGRWGRPGVGRHGLAGWAGGPLVLRRFQAGLAQVAAELPGEQDGVDHKWNERAVQGTGEVSPAEPAPYSRIPARKRGPSSWSLRRPTPLICRNASWVVGRSRARSRRVASLKMR